LLVLEFGVVDVAPLELPDVVESLFDSEEELGFVPLSADFLHPVVPNRRVEPTRVVPKIKVSFRVLFMTFFCGWRLATVSSAARKHRKAGNPGWRYTMCPVVSHHSRYDAGKPWGRFRTARSGLCLRRKLPCTA
jgi:hypothetical protein